MEPKKKVRLVREMMEWHPYLSVGDVADILKINKRKALKVIHVLQETNVDGYDQKGHMQKQIPWKKTWEYEAVCSVRYPKVPISIFLKFYPNSKSYFVKRKRKVNQQVQGQV